MSVQVRCSHCAWLFRVDDAFAGTRCRCKHCGAITDVPANGVKPPDLPRPMSPPPGKRPRIAVPRAHSGRRRSLLLTTAVVLAAVFVYTRWVPRGAPSQPPDVRSIPLEKESIARLPEPATLATLPREFLGKPLRADRIVWIIDGGVAMAEYYPDITTLVATAMALLDPASQRFGLYLASDQRSDYLQLSAAGTRSVKAGRELMQNFRHDGRPDLGRSFGEVASWKPQQVFLILTQPTDREAVNSIIRRAKSDEISVSVVTVGDPFHGWASIALETGGDYLCLRKRDLLLWVDRLVPPRLPEFVGQPRKAS